MITISLCMIVKNEEAVLARCLDSVKDIVDEIIIADTGSQDKTLEIAAEYTDKVYNFPWIDDFAAARNFSFSKATMNYIMWLDADDVILPRDREALLILKQTLSPKTDLVMLRYDLAYGPGGLPEFSTLRERLMRREAGFRWEGAVHEAITPAGRIERREDIAVSHKKAKPGDPLRNLKIYQKLLASGKALNARETFYYARELMDNGRNSEAAAAFEDFLGNKNGWVENNIEACRNLAACLARLGREDEALAALLQSLRYDVPRAETCCDIGLHFFNHSRYSEAAWWYERALGQPDTPGGGFTRPDCRGYIPALQLCVIYDRTGRLDDAERMNELAATFRPNDSSVISNREYFAARRAERKKGDPA